MNEIAIKVSIGKRIIDDNWQDIFGKLLAQKDIVKLDMIWDTIKILQNLPFYHKDPFDRMLISHAVANNLAFIGSDRHCASYDLLVIEIGWRESQIKTRPLTTPNPPPHLL